MDSLIRVIDKAAEICGGKNELARRIGMTPGNLSAAKTGKKALPAEHVAAIAQIVNIPAAELWLIAQDARNPFRARELAGIGIAAVILSACFSGNSEAITTTYATMSAFKEYTSSCIRQVRKHLQTMVEALRKPWTRDVKRQKITVELFTC